MVLAQIYQQIFKKKNQQENQLKDLQENQLKDHQKKEFIQKMKAIGAKGSPALVACLQLFVLIGFACYVLFLTLAISQSTIGTNTNPSEITAFSYPIQTWSFSVVSRALLFLPSLTGLYLLIVLSHFALLQTWAKTKLKGWKAAAKKCGEEYQNLIFWKDYAPGVAVLSSVIPCCERCIREKWLYPPFVTPTYVIIPEPEKENDRAPFVPPNIALQFASTAPSQVPLYYQDILNVNMALWPIAWCIWLSAPVIVFACSNDSKEVTCPILLAAVSAAFSYYLAQIVKSYYLGLAHSGPITPITSGTVVPITKPPLEIGSQAVDISKKPIPELPLEIGSPVDAIFENPESTFRPIA
jgi:hypothetical protein